ncbi:MAG: TetR/AcrR family transcriptional regulator [Reyranellaceae bacterium]
MTDAPDAALDAFLGLVAEKGYANVALRDVATGAGLGLAELYRRYPDKASLVAGFLARVDAEVLAGTSDTADPEETVRDRLFDVLMRRFDALRPYRAAVQAIRRAGLRDPLLALSLGPAVRRSMAAMLEGAGVPSDGIPGALRQSGLLVIYQAVSQVFEKDDTADSSKTMAALDSRLKRAEKWVQFVDKYTKRPPKGIEEPSSESASF